MKEIKKLINGLQFQLEDLHKILISKEIDMEDILTETVECLSYIHGYAERALESQTTLE